MTCTDLVFPRANLENQVGAPLDIGDAGLLKCIDNCQIEQPGIVSRSVWIFTGHEEFGVGRQVGEMNVSFSKVF